ncbi:(methyl)glyoxal oxidase [Salvia divinorum]|uniref:(Methyl)glyoxal oxidase n=1 Tax=Salvia divinorum TaxID=28513 RepID=A0ABD1I275_SALDI
MPPETTLLCFFLVLLLPPHASASGDGSKWNLLLSNVGISAMHMQLLHADRMVIFDFGPSNISLPNGRCCRDSNDRALTVDCIAHSVEYNVGTNSIHPSPSSPTSGAPSA